MPTPRATFVSGYAKTGLPVVLILRKDRYDGLVARYNNVQASRAMAIVDGRLRGPVTRVRITISEKQGNLTVERYAKGDPRTERGRQKIIDNVRRAVRIFQDMALARSETEIFGSR